MLLAVRPVTTVVLNRAFAPRTCSAATEVASLVVDAGVYPVAEFSEYSTCPVVRSVTRAPTLLPSAPELSSGVSVLDRPDIVTPGGGPLIWPGGGRGAEPGPAGGAGAMLAARHRASRGGSIRATATPAPIVN